jgi:iron complex outermembrane receptor protein
MYGIVSDYGGICFCQGCRSRCFRDGDIIVNGKHEKNFKPDSGQVGIYRNKSLVDTPANVVVINRALLDAQNDHELADALKNVAGVTQQGTSPLTSNSFTVHGVPTDSRTSYRMNGTLPVINYVPFPLEDKERVEVLSGVQAIYYGFTTPAALVNMVMKRAGKDPVTSLRLDGDANGSFGGGVDVGRLYGAQAAGRSPLSMPMARRWARRSTTSRATAGW